MQAVVNYVKDSGNGVVPFVLDFGWTGVQSEPTKVEIEDARDISSELSLDKQGFVLSRVISGVTDYQDQQQIEQRWIPAVTDMVKRVTGAKWVVAWAHNTRFSDNIDAAKSTDVAAPARNIHSDLDVTFDPMTLHTQPHGRNAADEIKRRLGNTAPRRWRTFNVWQQISPPPQDIPLTVCDISSVSSEDILRGEGTDGTPESPIFKLSFFQKNPEHRWYYFSNMLPGEAIIFSGINPLEKNAYGRVPHTAFDLPDMPLNAVPRSSIEIRTLAIFEE